jgi:hypothetical protein
MEFKNLSGDAKHHANAALAQLITSHGFLDAEKVKTLGEQVAQAFIAMESYGVAPEKCTEDDDPRERMGCDGQAFAINWAASESIFRGMTHERIASLFDKYGFRDQLGHDLRNSHEFVLLTKAVANAYGSPERIVLS